MSGQGHTTECRKRLEDVMMTDASTATRIKAIRLRAYNRIFGRTTNPSISSGSGQHKRDRFSNQDLEPKPDIEMQTGGKEAPVTRKRSAETDAERLEQETAETVKADADARKALKRKAENDPSDSEVEDSAMNSLAELWHREDDPDSEVDLLIFQQRDRHVASVHETGGDKLVCEEPETPFRYDERGWDYIDDTSGKLLNNTLVEKARAEETSVIREIGVWEVVDRPRDKVVFGTRWVDINKGDEHKSFCRSRLEKFKRQADWSSRLCEVFLFCATIDELPNELGQPVAWTEPVVLMLIDVRRAHFYSPALRKVFVELLEEAGTDKSKVGRLVRSMKSCRDAGVNWEFAICQVMISIGLVQGRASPCIYRHLDKKFRVWVHGDDFVPLGYIVNVRWFFVKLQEFWVVTNRGILGPPGYHDSVQAFECWAGSWNGPLMTSPGRQILDMQSSSGSRSA